MNRKNIIRRLTCATLLAGLLTSCSGGENNDPAGELGDVGEKSGVLTHVFRAEELTVPENGEIESNVEPLYTKEGGLKALCRESYEDGENYVTRYYLYEIDLDGGEPTRTDVPTEDDAWINCGAITEDGLVYLTSSWDEKTDVSSYTLHIWTEEDGSSVEVENINDLFPDTGEDPSWFYVNAIQTDDDGYVYLAADSAILVLNPEGVKAFDCVCAGFAQNLQKNADGEVYLSGYLGDGKGLQKIDKTARGLGEILQLPASVGANDYYFGEGYDLYYSTSEGLYGWNDGMETGEMTVSWSNSDLNVDNFNSLKILSPEMILVSYYDEIDWNDVYAVLKQSADRDFSNIAVVELAYVNGDYDLQDQIIRFNQTHDDVRIVANDYSRYNTKENGYTGGYTRLVNDILNGLYKPDIVCGYNDSVISTLIQKNLFVDLYSFMDADSDVKKDDLLGCVKNVYEIDGKLAAICDYVSVYGTFLTTRDKVGDKTSWTLDEMLDFAMNLEDGQYLMEYLTQESAPNRLLGSNGYARFVDLENNVCNFEDPTFIKYLNYLATLPTYDGGGYYEVDYDSDNRYEAYQSGKVALCDVSYYDLYEIQGDGVYFNTDDVVRIGYPVSENGESGTHVGGYAYLILSTSERSAEAWTFLSDLITREQSKISYHDGFSVLKSKIREEAKEMEESGARSLYGFDGSRATWSDADGDWTPTNLDDGIVTQFSMEAAEEFIAWLDTVGIPVWATLDAEATNIINEEITSFLGGARSAEDAARIIQSRVSIWLAERS